MLLSVSAGAPPTLSRCPPFSIWITYTCAPPRCATGPQRGRGAARAGGAGQEGQCTQDILGAGTPSLGTGPAAPALPASDGPLLPPAPVASQPPPWPPPAASMAPAAAESTVESL